MCDSWASCFISYADGRQKSLFIGRCLHTVAGIPSPAAAHFLIHCCRVSIPFCSMPFAMLAPRVTWPVGASTTAEHCNQQHSWLQNETCIVRYNMYSILSLLVPGLARTYQWYISLTHSLHSRHNNDIYLYHDRSSIIILFSSGNIMIFSIFSIVLKYNLYYYYLLSKSCTSNTNCPSP